MAVVLGWSAGSIARAFLLAATAVVLLAVLSWISVVRLRRVRPVASAVAVSAGTLFTLVFGEMLQRSVGERDNLLAIFLLVSALCAAAGGWIIDDRIAQAVDEEQRRRDADTAKRHAEMLAAVSGHKVSTARVSARDVALIAAAAVLLRRR